ncbi:MAG: YggS family pyridoxal phosphate-dependent enzyme [Deltaproteobacteria bacterium]|nr:YggS family pyridoxal phosphate-dependent enzyme [Deltaproteobacteria bacterium]MBW2398429.1 YggS family pyridoxal phosphate-dependent enzyme [Deltaproteobacteria bacterium]MBW2667133.1 YggS family pyridoxal phosphate-dependent enzyme [Deltaproteobacteria bacterium]
MADRIAEIRARITAAAERAGRPPESVRLIGVAKRIPAERVAAAVRAGLRDLAENYLQEARTKLTEVRAMLETSGHKCPKWHFIGQLQRNKAGPVASAFDWVQTVDRERLGHELNRRAASAGRSLEVLLQVDLSGEQSKGGVAPDALPTLLAAAAGWPQLKVRGLMAIPAPVETPEAARPAFAQLRMLRDALRAEPGGAGLSELSMGMSGDFEVAVEEGATMVRVGTAIFGAR